MRRFQRELRQITAVVSFLACAWPAWAADFIPAERRLPPDVLQFVSIRDTPALCARVRGSLIGQMIDDPVFWKCCDEIGGRGFQELLRNRLEANVVAPIEKCTGLPAHELLRLFNGEAAFAVVREDAKTLAIVLLVDIGDRGDDIARCIERAAHEIPGPAIRFHRQSVQGTACTRIEQLSEKGDRPARQLGIYCLNQSYFVFASSVKTLDSVLSRWSGNNPETFADSSDFKSIQASCRRGLDHLDLAWHLRYDTHDGLQTLFLESIAGLPFYFAVVTPLAVLGGTDVPAISYTDDTDLSCIGGVLSVRAGDYDVIHRMGSRPAAPNARDNEVAAGKPRNPIQLVGAGLVESARHLPPEWIPDDAAQVWQWRWDPDMIGKRKLDLDAFAHAYDSLAPEAQSLLRLLAKSGVNGALTCFTGDVHFVRLRKEQSESQTDGVLAMGVRDAANLENVLTGLHKLDAISPYDQRIAGRDAWTVKLTRQDGHLIQVGGEPEDDEDEDDGDEEIASPFGTHNSLQTCHLAVAHSSLFLSSSPDVLDRVLQPRPRGVTIAANKSLEALDAHLPSTRLFSQRRSFSSADVQKMVGGLVNLVSLVDGNSPESTPAVAAPSSLQALVKYFSNSTGCAEVDGSGVLITVFRLR